jgi:histidyl-tRNA synthetase
MLADAEVLKVFSELLGNFKLDFNLRVNDRRLLESALITRTGIVPDKFKSICHVLDRLDKEPWETCAESLIEIGVTGEQLAKIEEFVKSTSRGGGSSESVHQAINRLESMIDNKEVLKELRLLGDYVDAMGIADRVKLDMSLVRGLDYYTGMIFEAGIVGGEEANLGLGSIAAGGRYDNLIGMFGKNQIPAAGGSLGIERIFNILETRAEKEFYIANPIDIVVGSIGQVPKQEILKVASWLWDQGLKTEIFYEETQKMGE